MQTIKFGKLRASNDPDRSESQHGIHYGVNIPRKMARGRMAFIRVTRASFRRAGK